MITIIIYDAITEHDTHPTDSLHPNGFFDCTFWAYNLTFIKISQKYAYFSKIK